MEKWEKRDRKREQSRKMKVDGAGVRTLAQILAKRAAKLRRKMDRAAL